MFYFILALIALIILSPVIITVVLVYLGASGLSYLGLSTSGVVVVLLLMLISSSINIPISKKRMVRVLETRFLGLVKNYVWRAQGVSINVGGAIIPLIIVTYLIMQIPVYPVLLITIVVALVSFASSRFIPRVGVVAPVIFPVLFASLMSLAISPLYAAETAFVSGVLGVIIGADIVRLPSVLKKHGGVMSIGGAGVFDGIFIVGIVSAIIAGI